MQFGAVEEAIEGRLIVFAQGAPERRPGPAFGLDELTERWQRSTHNLPPPVINALCG
jgi:hypothetical protein